MKDFHGHRIISNKNMGIELQNILKKEKAGKIMVVSGSTYERTYLKKWFEQMPFEFVQFSGFSQNPKYEDICAGVELFRKENCDMIISVGGGSAIDTAKSIKLFAVLDQNGDYLKQESTEV